MILCLHNKYKHMSNEESCVTMGHGYRQHRIGQLRLD